MPCGVNIRVNVNAVIFIRSWIMTQCCHFVRNSLLLASLLATVNPCTAKELRVPAEFKSIQAAVDAADAGDTILVEPGLYEERVTLRPRLTLRSAGVDAKGSLGLTRAEATIIDGGGATKSGPGIATAEGCIVDGFTVRNVGIYDEQSWQKHYETHGEEQSYDHIGEPGIAGIAVDGVNCEVRNNIVHHIGYTGIAIMGADGKDVSPLIEKNVCYRNMGGGIGAMQGNTATIQNNICFENFYAGIGHSGASPRVLNNECYGNIRAGIGISEDSSPLVRGNRCHHNRRAGIGIRTGQETAPLVEENECFENDYAGIGVREEAAPTIRRNRCYRNKMAGIGSRTGATPKIVENECFENEKSGIGQMSGCRTVIEGNYVHHNKTSGIGFDPGEGGESQVTGNRVIDNEMVAAGVNAGWNVTFTDNQLSRQGGLPPIVMVFAGSRVVFKGNTIRGGGVAGVRVSGEVIAENNHFDGTSFRPVGPPNFAIWGLKGSRVTMLNNRINGWRHALSADESAVAATANQVTHSSRAAFVISKPVDAPVLTGNSLLPSKQTDVVALVDGTSWAADANTILTGLAPAVDSSAQPGPPPGRGPGNRGPGGPPPGSGPQGPAGRRGGPPQAKQANP